MTSERKLMSQKTWKKSFVFDGKTMMVSSIESQNMPEEKLQDYRRQQKRPKNFRV